MTDFDRNRETWRSLIEKDLDQRLADTKEAWASLIQAMRYSTLGGGKRVRGLTVLLVSDLLGVSVEQALPFASAIEMIHAYSLIHDDLPAMDNDDERRGKPSCHRAFNEAIAILAGDTLLNKGMEILIRQCSKGLAHQRAALQIVQASGETGMTGGQCLDLLWNQNGETADSMTHQQRVQMESMKTGALITATFLSPAELAEAAPELKESLKALGYWTGLLFQLKDNWFDHEECPQSTAQTAQVYWQETLGILNQLESYGLNTQSLSQWLKDLSVRQH